MNRPLAMLAALLAAAISVSSACLAGPSSPADKLNFELKPSIQASKLQLALWSNDRHHNMTGSSYAPAELTGLDLNALRLSGQRPISFAYIREPGRIDCSGTGGNSVATGRCSFSPDAAFNQFLAARGIGRPSFEQSFELVMTGASRDLVDALAAFHYARPGVEKLAELAAVGVTRSYISSLAATGSAPKSLDDLTQFAALEVTPEFINSFARIGYTHLPVDKLIELKALDVTPGYVRSLQAHGLYPRSAEQLVKLKSAGLGDDR